MPRKQLTVEEMKTTALEDTSSVMEKTADEKRTLAQKTSQQINRKYGANTITVGVDPVERIPTKLACFDLLTRQFDKDDNLIGYGLGRGQYTMIWGNSDVGKSCLTFAIARELQKYAPVLFTDAERKFDAVWAQANGVDVDNLHFSRPNSMEDYLNTLLTISNNALEQGEEIPYSLNIVDSVVSVASEGEMHNKDGKERTMEDNTIAIQPRTLSQFFRMATGRLAKGKISTILLNQIRVAGIGGYRTYEDFPGGNALRHYCHHIVRAYRSQTKEKPQEELGLTPSHEVRLKVTKGINETVETSTLFFVECGFDNTYDLLKQLLAYDLMTKSNQGRYTLEGDTESYFLKDMYYKVEDNYDTLYEKLMLTRNRPKKEEQE